MARAIRCTTPSGAGRCPAKSIIPAMPHMIRSTYLNGPESIFAGIIQTTSAEDVEEKSCEMRAPRAL